MARDFQIVETRTGRIRNLIGKEVIGLVKYTATASTPNRDNIEVHRNFEEDVGEVEAGKALLERAAAAFGVEASKIKLEGIGKLEEGKEESNNGQGKQEEQEEQEEQERGRGRGTLTRQF